VLHGNGSVLHKLPLRFFGGSTASVEPQLRSNFGKNGSVRNRFYQDKATTSLKLYSLPEGTYAGVAWMLPQGVGAMASIGATLGSVTAAGSGAMGVNIAGSGGLIIEFALASGQLISSGYGSAAFAFDAAGTALATLNGLGSASIAFATNTPQIGALGWVSASGAYSVTAGVTSYAIGKMEGSTLNGGAMTPESIAAAIIAASKNTPLWVDVQKIIGQQVRGSGSQADPWGP